ncbi:MAG: hypothetical protein K2P92_09215 [Bdellovibrionaceae bacterium]|nr:hypothetical protein [Pseudobdellovibrionaceae bacterium]
MLKNFWKSLPITLICVSAYAATTPPAASTVKAPAAPGTSTMAAPAPDAPKPTTFGLLLEATYEAQAYAQKDQDTGSVTRSETMAYGFTPSMKFGDGYKLSSYWEYDQNLNTDSNSSGDWIDPSVSLSKKAWELGKYIKLGPSGTVTLPMSNGSKNNTNLKYAAAGKLTASLNTANMGMDAFSASYGVQYARFFTEFSTNAKGDPVTQSRLRQDINLGYQITDPLSFNFFFRHDSKFSSEGVTRGFFIMQQTLEYAINDSFSVNVNHTNAADVLKKDEQENYQNAIKFDDIENSTYSIGVGLSI